MNEYTFTIAISTLVFIIAVVCLFTSLVMENYSQIRSFMIRFLENACEYLAAWTDNFYKKYYRNTEEL